MRQGGALSSILVQKRGLFFPRQRSMWRKGCPFPLSFRRSEQLQGGLSASNKGAPFLFLTLPVPFGGIRGTCRKYTLADVFILPFSSLGTCPTSISSSEEEICMGREKKEFPSSDIIIHRLCAIRCMCVGWLVGWLVGWCWTGNGTREG